MQDLKKYQSDALTFLSGRKCAALFIEQGLGKSRIILEEIMAEPSRALIICPKSLIPTWRDQIDLWATGFRANVIKKINDIQNDQNTINLISVDFFSRKKDLNRIVEFLIQENSYFAVDESTTIKNVKSARTKNILKLSKMSRGKKRILTGAPITQTPFDMFSQMSFLENEIFEQKSFFAFQNYYGEMRFRHLTPYTGFNEVIGYKNISEMMKRIAPYSFRLTKAEAKLELPDKIYQKILVEIDGDQKRAYGKLKNELLVDFSDGTDIMIPHALARLIKLHQILSGFVNTEEEIIYYNKNAKIEVLMDLLQFNPDKNILIWVNFINEAKLIAAMLDKNKIKYKAVYASTPIEEVDEYRSGEFRILIMTQKKGGLGLTLINTNVVIFFSNNYSVVGRTQAEDRCHRIGLDHNVIYYDLIAEDTVDEKLYDHLIQKKMFNSTIMEWLK